jgi:hypothetical protein
MKYRDIEYTVVQGLGRQLWKWGVALETKAVTGQAATKADAVAEAERAIDRALALKKLRLVPPRDRDRRAQDKRPDHCRVARSRVSDLTYSTPTPRRPI